MIDFPAFPVPEYLISYRQALGALGAIAAGSAIVSGIAILAWYLTGYRPALRWSYTFLLLGVFAVGTTFVSLGVSLT